VYRLAQVPAHGVAALAAPKPLVRVLAPALAGPIPVWRVLLKAGEYFNPATKSEQFLRLYKSSQSVFEARKARGRSKPAAEVPGVKNAKVFNRWLRETHPEIYKRVG
jgi:hypothetical protein